MKSIHAALFVAVSTVAFSTDAAAQMLAFDRGRVTVNAAAVAPSALLAEWARVGQTEVVNLERVAGPAVTITAAGLPEAKLLELILGGANYVVVARGEPWPSPNVSSFKRILIATSAGVAVPAKGATTPPAKPKEEPWPLPVNLNVVDDTVEVLTPAKPPPPLKPGEWLLPVNLNPPVPPEEANLPPAKPGVAQDPPVWILPVNLTPDDDPPGPQAPLPPAKDPETWLLPVNLNADADNEAADRAEALRLARELEELFAAPINRTFTAAPGRAIGQERPPR
jgi:hypothetical protein